MLGANPYASNGSLCTAPDFPGRLEAMRARGGQAGRRRPAPQPHGRGGRRVARHPPGHRRAAAHGHGPRAVRGRPGRSRRPRAARTSPASTTGRALASRSRRRPSRPACGIDAADDPPHRRTSSPPRRRAAVYGRIGTCTAGVRHAGVLAGRRPQRPDRQPRPARRRDVHPPGRRWRRRPGGVRVSARASRIGRGRTRVRGLPEVFGEYPVVALAEEIDGADEERPGRGRWSPSPATRCCPPRTPAGSTPPSTSLDAHGRRRHLPQRDHPPRRRDPAAAVAAAAAPTTTSACCSSRSATSPTTARPCCRSSAGQPDEWEILAKLALIALGQGADADPSDARRRDRSPAWSSTPSPTRPARSTGASPTRS